VEVRNEDFNMRTLGLDAAMQIVAPKGLENWCAANLNGAWQRVAPKGHEDLAQGFNPGYGILMRCALKGHKNRCKAAGAGIRNATRTHSGAAFRAHPILIGDPGLKPWAKFSSPFGASNQDSLSAEAHALYRHTVKIDLATKARSKTRGWRRRKDEDDDEYEDDPNKDNPNNDDKGETKY
jgi:hypothetical protein